MRKGKIKGSWVAPPSFLQEPQQRVLPHPPPLTSPAALQTGRESLPARFLELGLDRRRKGLALGEGSIGVWPSGGGRGGGGQVSEQNSGPIQILPALLLRTEGLWEWQRLWEGHRPHWDGERNSVQKNSFILKITELEP